MSTIGTMGVALAAVATVLATVGPIDAAAAAPAGGATVARGLSVHSKSVPLASLPAPTREALSAGGQAAPASVALFELVNDANGKCLDAATQNLYSNGDTVQMWNCFNDPANHANQWWFTLQTDDGYTEIMNEGSGRCLDADNSRGGFLGAKVQLWQCFDNIANNPNQWWYFDNYATNDLINAWGGALDAATQTIGVNGGRVQLWVDNFTTNQLWFTHL
jgi:Ricin-type beta-trefoil lectin domain